MCGLLHKGLDLSGPLRSLPLFCLQDSHFWGGPEGTRTPGLRHARAALSRLSYGPAKPKQS